MDKAMLVPDEIVNDMVRGWLSEMDNDAWLLDGYPRTVAQAEALDHFLTQRGTLRGRGRLDGRSPGTH